MQEYNSQQCVILEGFFRLGKDMYGFCFGVQIVMILFLEMIQHLCQEGKKKAQMPFQSEPYQIRGGLFGVG